MGRWVYVFVLSIFCHWTHCISHHENDIYNEAASKQRSMPQAFSSLAPNSIQVNPSIFFFQRSFWRKSEAFRWSFFYNMNLDRCANDNSFMSLSFGKRQNNNKSIVFILTYLIQVKEGAAVHQVVFFIILNYANETQSVI